MVLEQAAWIGVAGLLLGGALSGVLLWLAGRQDIPAILTALALALCLVVIFLLTLLSGLFAMHGLLRADPVRLLR